MKSKIIYVFYALFILVVFSCCRTYFEGKEVKFHNSISPLHSYSHPKDSLNYVY